MLLLDLAGAMLLSAAAITSAAGDADPFDVVKGIPLDSRGRLKLSLGLRLREQIEYYDDSLFDYDEFYLLQRYMPSADLEIAGQGRIFGELKTAIASFQAGAPFATQVDYLDVHQLFADYRIGDPAGGIGRFTARPGRQEMFYGSGRLLDDRRGPNVMPTWDGAKLFFEREPGAEGTGLKLRADAFLVKPVQPRPGVFDDRAFEDRWVWGLYTTLSRILDVDVYYIGLDRNDKTYDQGTADETRHFFGARFFGATGGFDWNIEALYQMGSFGRGDIDAFAVFTDTGFTFERWPLAPRISLKADVQSGDRDASDRDLQTFNPLQPRGNYYGEAGIFGPSNLYALRPDLTIVPVEGVFLGVGCTFFWRQSLDDGAYGYNADLFVSGIGLHERMIGAELTTIVGWQATRHLYVGATYAHVYPGAFLREADAKDHIDFLSASILFRF